MTAASAEGANITGAATIPRPIAKLEGKATLPIKAKRDKSFVIFRVVFIMLTLLVFTVVMFSSKPSFILGSTDF